MSYRGKSYDLIQKQNPALQPKEGFFPTVTP